MILAAIANAELLSRRSVIRCRAFCVLLLVVSFAAPGFCQDEGGDTSSPKNGGQARIVIVSNLNDVEDDVSIRIVNNTDSRVLTDVLNHIAHNFRRMPSNVSYTQGDPYFPEATSAAIRFYLPVVPRQGGELPTDEFVMAVGKHATRMRIVYVVTGAREFRLANRFSRDDVDFTSMEPFINPQSATGRLAIYEADVIIKTPAVVAGPVEAQRTRKFNRLALAVGIAIMIIALGIIISQFLPRRREMDQALPAETTDNDTHTGGHHD